MVIDDLDVLGRIIRPFEANPELIVSPDRILSRPVARQGFKAVTRRSHQVSQPFRRCDRFKLTASDDENLGWKPLRTFCMKDQFGGLIPK
jgi:hypothetical protein